MTPPAQRQPLKTRAIRMSDEDWEDLKTVTLPRVRELIRKTARALARHRKAETK